MWCQQRCLISQIKMLWEERGVSAVKLVIGFITGFANPLSFDPPARVYA